MQVQLNTDNHITGSAELAARVQATIEHELRHVAQSITRVEVYLNDLNSTKTGADDIRCMLEARLAGMQPVCVEHRAATVDLALAGAADQMERALKSILGKAGAAEKRGGSIRHAGPDQELH